MHRAEFAGGWRGVASFRRDRHNRQAGAGEVLKERTVEAIARAFERAGVEFIAENGGGPGVRLAKRT